MRKLSPFIAGIFTLGLALTASAGEQISTRSQVDAKGSKVTLAPEKHTFFPEDPAGLLTAGVLFSEHLTTGYIDTITGLYAPQNRESFFFLNSRYVYDDNSQFISSTGLGFRQMLFDRNAILGVNAYYDSLQSEHDNDYKQLGLGAELLTKWVDARVNYNLPEDDRFEVDRTHGAHSTRRFEAALEGVNAEVGFLLPGIEKYAEVRLFAGYYHYDNPFGGDFEGFKARLEARLLPGLIADVEYWDDTAINGGHWTAGVRASLPFSLIAMLRGHNPFEGASDYFRPRSREFSERMSEMVIRAPRIQTVTSDPRHRGADF